MVINGPTSTGESDGFACDEDAFNARVIRLPSFITPYLSAIFTTVGELRQVFVLIKFPVLNANSRVRNLLV